MAKKHKTLLDQLNTYKGERKPKRDLFAKLDKSIQDEIKLIVKRFNNGELNDKFSDRTSLAQWIYDTMRETRPNEFPILNDVKYFSALLGQLDA